VTKELIVKKIAFLYMLFTVVMLISCDRYEDSNELEAIDTVSKATQSRYSELEIQDYMGVKLDPSVGPRDNSISGIPEVDINVYQLKITGLVKNQVLLDYDDVLDLMVYEKLITLHCVEGWDATILWKGAMLSEIIGLAGADESADTVIFHCVDGYTTALPLKTVVDKNMILAYSSNSTTLPPSLGYPFIVVAEDKLGYKWARWVNEIELSDDKDYEGYWERNGYDNDADI
jgi:DMSO/TMAO reductase YedYZ molybdopterin-dependent catalytic subunit